MTADVFLLIFRFPFAVNAERHVLHVSLSGGAVMQSMYGRPAEVPVPRKMSSMSIGWGDIE